MGAGKPEYRALERNIRLELKRILDASEFEASERNRKFLTYIVEETLAGRSDRIKAYSIATSVFRRGDDFDPQQDSIVRIEAARLRRAIEHFYLKSPGTSPIRIEIPKGAYVPEFRPCERPVHAEEAGASTHVPVIPAHGPRILVENFEQDGECGLYPNMGRKLTRNVIAALTRFTELVVYGLDAAELRDVHSLEGRGGGEFPADYLLSGSATILAGSVHVEMLLRRWDGRFVWAYEASHEAEEEGSPHQLNDFIARITSETARVVAQRGGILYSQAWDASGERQRHFSGCQKLIDCQEYRRSLNPELFEKLRSEFEQSIQDDPGFISAYSCLSMLYTDAARFGYDLPATCPNPLERAMELADKAIRLAPACSRAYHAKAIAQWQAGLREESIRSLETARQLNPNDSELLAELGCRMATQMDWKAAVPLIEESYARNPLQPGSYRIGLFLYNFAEGRYEDALREASAIGAPANAHVHLAVAAALSRLGRLDGARAELREVERMAPGLRANLEADLVSRHIHPDLIGDIISALGRADPGWHSAAHRSHMLAG